MSCSLHLYLYYSTHLLPIQVCAVCIPLCCQVLLRGFGVRYQSWAPTDEDPVYYRTASTGHLVSGSRAVVLASRLYTSKLRLPTAYEYQSANTESRLKEIGFI